MQLDTAILAPAAVLAGWTMIVFLWMLSRRLPAFAAAGIKLGEAPAGMRGGDSEAQMPPRRTGSRTTTRILWSSPPSSTPW